MCSSPSFLYQTLRDSKVGQMCSSSLQGQAPDLSKQIYILIINAQEIKIHFLLPDANYSRSKTKGIYVDKQRSRNSITILKST